MKVERGFFFVRLHRFARSTSAALLHYRFREIRHPQGRAAMDRWRYSDSEEFLRPRKFLGIRHPSDGSSQPRIFSPASVSDGFVLRRIYVWGVRGLAGRETVGDKTPGPPPPPGGWG